MHSVVNKETSLGFTFFFSKLGASACATNNLLCVVTERIQNLTIPERVTPNEAGEGKGAY